MFIKDLKNLILRFKSLILRFKDEIEINCRFNLRTKKSCHMAFNERKKFQQYLMIFNYFRFHLVVTQANDQQSILNTVQQEMAQRRKQKAANGNAVVVMKNGTNANNGIGNSPVAFITRQDSRLSVKSLIESIENTSKQQTGSNTSLNTLTDQPQPQQMSEKIIPTEEKQQKALSNNNNNSNIISTTNSVVNGTPKSGGKSYAKI